MGQEVNANHRFQTLLRPHRSASVKTINGVICLMAGLWAAVGLGFSAFGAWPVTGFLGLDVALLYWALRWNNNTGRTCESIQLSDDRLVVERTNHWGKSESWSFQPYWLQINLKKTNRHETRLELRSHGEALIIGAFLTNPERAELAHRLRHEIALLLGCMPRPVS